MSAHFAYAQARVQARFGALIEDGAWQQLDAARSMSGFLEEARNTVLSHWVDGISLVSNPHHIEQSLRRRLHALILEARNWAPEPWSDAVAWAAWLPELPLLRRLLADPGFPSWAAKSPLLGPVLNPPRADRLLPALRTAGAAPLLRELGKQNSLEANWLRHWRDLWPTCPRREREQLERLIEMIAVHGAQFPTLPPEQGWSERKRLRSGLRRLFRRTAVQPTALFAWLALVALELELLRAALVQRTLFAQARRP